MWEEVGCCWQADEGCEMEADCCLERAEHHQRGEAEGAGVPRPQV